MTPEQLPLFRTPAPAAAPQKQRLIHLGAQVVAYDLRLGLRRLSLSIDERGLRVGAPRQAALADIEHFIRQHATWVLEKLDAHVARGARRQVSIRDGLALPLGDGQAWVRVTAGANRVAWRENELILAARPEADLDRLARRGLQQRALAVFSERVAQYAHRMGRAAPPLGLSSARTRWGSCQGSGIRLNWRLIHLPLRLIDYVVAHELAHLVEMNHSPRFWREVGKLYPDWQAARRELKTRGAELPII